MFSLFLGSQAWAQTAEQIPTLAADCLIKTLGRPSGDSTVVQAFQAMGLTPPNQPGGLNNTRQGVRVTLRKGLIESLVFLNDSVRQADEVYRGYRGELPFGLTFADSLGIEENRLFNEDAAYQASRDVGIDGLVRYVAGLKVESSGQSYRMEMRFMPARYYFELKRAWPGQPNLKRTYWYRFMREAEPVRGKYLELPLVCDGGQGGYVARQRYLNTDSAWGVKLEITVPSLGRGFLKEHVQGTGVGVGIVLHAPLSRRYSPPIRQQFGFSFTGFDYKGFSDVEDAPSLSRYSLIYGLYAQPRHGLAHGSWGGLYPYLDARLTGDLFVNDRIRASDESFQEPANVTWGTHAGAGMVYQTGNFLAGAGAGYTYCRRASYIEVLRDGPDIYAVRKARSAYRALAVQLWIGFTFLGQ